jgi:hypothetical protein
MGNRKKWGWVNNQRGGRMMLNIGRTLITDDLTTNPFIFSIVMPSIRKRTQQNWDEFNTWWMVDVKSPSWIGANWLVIAMKWVILTLSHITIGITLVCTDVGHVLLAAKGQVVTN